MSLLFRLQPGIGINASEVVYEGNTASFTGAMAVQYATRLHVVADEAAVVANLLRKQGFEVYSVKCKAGAVPKYAAGATVESLGVENPTEKQVSLCSSPMCNPIAQATLLNRAGTEFNICLGLCVGHDSLFYKYSEAPVTTLVAKDRVTGHNPAAAIYCADTYFSKRNTIED